MRGHHILALIIATAAAARADEIAPGIDATVPRVWKAAPLIPDSKTDLGRVTASFNDPSTHAYIQIRYRLCEKPADCEDLDQEEWGLSSQLSAFSDGCCLRDRCAPPWGQPRGPAYECHRKATLTTSKHSRETADRNDGIVFDVVVFEVKTPGRPRRSAVLAVSAAVPKASYSALVPILREFLKALDRRAVDQAPLSNHREAK